MKEEKHGERNREQTSIPCDPFQAYRWLNAYGGQLQFSDTVVVKTVMLCELIWPWQGQLAPVQSSSAVSESEPKVKKSIYHSSRQSRSRRPAIAGQSPLSHLGAFGSLSIHHLERKTAKAWSEKRCINQNSSFFAVWRLWTLMFEVRCSVSQ